MFCITTSGAPEQNKHTKLLIIWLLTVTSINAQYGVSFHDSPDDRLSFTPVVPTSVYTPQPLRETNVNPNFTAIKAVANLREVLYQSFTLPKRTLRTFDGNPLDFYGFIKSFNATIREQVTEPASQLEYLIDLCTGKAREAIKHLSIVTPPSLGMNQAMETLHNRFGQKHIVVKAHLDSITDGPSVKLNKNSLDKFVTDLTNCQIVMEAWNFASELNSSQTLKNVFKRLPIPLQRKVVERVDLDADGHFAKFNQLVKFVKESAMRTNSFFGQVLADTEANKKLKQQNTSKSSKVFSVQTIPATFAAEPTIVCPDCSANHPLWKCERFKSKPVQQCWIFVEKQKLCFNCLGSKLTRNIC